MKFIVMLVLITSCASHRKPLTRYQRDYLESLRPPGRAFVESCYEREPFHECMGRFEFGKLMWQKFTR